ncbi:response regulator [Lutibacter sp.]|uniref:response regulator n=1 Tax=Lutibacter sp. TaxID=1925666 RepID=UPI002733930B|nr:response regulator [Lutibacter sp.]MDP3312432.1 response regulator [Lutibacter sp.]
MNHSNLNNPILLIEDNPVDIDLTLRAFKLRKLTNPIIVARDGEEALSLMNTCLEQNNLPIVVLLDLKLPKIHGLEVLKEFKSHLDFKKIPVVILTTSADNLDIQSAYEIGANSYIVKPVNFEKFIEVVEKIELYWTVINNPAL